ncbi:DNA polymerase III subunit gamma and tau [Psychromicrobium xiongbiense]|uniref:DNA polymerase III subunit gamma and tau n=1 Tax=Psychromicrobium xiongbiense TaxID=3051184 RepID=UPI002556B6CB|nr:DNA polymerase III subunit gamma and tau [Psychromicrobium sp. YIM S02556]
MTTALYRRYRPDTFAEVIGQEHVTEPLMAALRKNRVNHAYLFSGPRGCGKTTSARILARCLNCAQGPIDIPCGVCPSCVELATGGPGSLDVIEIDAASHGGVDDARDLRERATFAPVRDRYKIFIIDEAHMVTSAGFNALLKIVEEPPEHIKFIFATTEPDKVIGTIRSRTHHYPFRLVPPEPLMAYLQELCEREHVPVAPGVLSLVVRAGGGSVRDTLSVLDQLMAGATDAGLDYERAVALLGYTHSSLLDSVVDALAASDAGTVFRAVDRVIQTGLDPRRFVEDLLERFRDLIIVQALPENAGAILRGTPEDQIAKMRQQSTQLGRAELSRAADVCNSALTDMSGATSPRLHLELLCARLLLPGAEQGERGLAARLDRVERRLSYAGSPESGSVGAAPEVGRAEARSAVAQTSEGLRPETDPAETSSAVTRTEPQREESAASTGRPDDWPSTAQPGAGRPRTAPSDSPARPDSAARADAAASAAQPAPNDGIEMLRRAWPDVLAALSKVKRSSWALIEANGTPLSFDGTTLILGFATDGLASAFTRGEHGQNLVSAIASTLGLNCKVAATTHSGGSSAPNPKAPAEPPREAATRRDVPSYVAPSSSAPSYEPHPDEPPLTEPPEEDYPEPEPRRYSPPPLDESREQIWSSAPLAPEAADTPPSRGSSFAASLASTLAASVISPAPSESSPPSSESSAPTASRVAASGSREAQRPASIPVHQITEVADPGWGNPQEAPDWMTGGQQAGSPEADGAQAGGTENTDPAHSSDAAPARPETAGQSLYQRLSQQAHSSQPQGAQPGGAASDRASASAPEPAAMPVEDVPSADDETIEESVTVGRAAVERILGGRLVEERPLS